MGGVAAVNGNSSASTIKKRKKDEIASTAYKPGQANNVPFGADGYQMASYRGGYYADTAYQSPNGTKWTDNIANVSVINLLAQRQIMTFFGSPYLHFQRYHPQGYDVSVDDSEGHYIIREGALVAGRCECRKAMTLILEFKEYSSLHLSPDSIKNLLGQGTFGKVVRCKDMLRDREVAIKIIRSTQKYTDAASIEIRVLKVLRSHDPNNEK